MENIGGSNRINFGYTMQKSQTTDKKTGNVTTTYRGQFLWMNRGVWRVKGSAFSQTVTKNGLYVSGATTPAYLTYTCPSYVGLSGSNPKCGLITGTAVLQHWNPALNDGLGDWEYVDTVSFTATMFDGGSKTTCVKKTCSTSLLADWFSLALSGYSITDGIPLTTPVTIDKTQGGSIVVK